MNKFIRFTDEQWGLISGLARNDATLAVIADTLGVGTETVTREIKDKYNESFSQYKKKQLEFTVHQIKKVAVQMALRGDFRFIQLILRNLDNWDKEIGPTNNIMTIEQLIFSTQKKEVKNDEPKTIETTCIGQ